MQLEQRLETYVPIQRQKVYFLTGALEYLSASAMYSFSSPIGGSSPLSLTGGPRGFKILGSSGPLMRLDFPAHHRLPERHLQYGKSDFLIDPVMKLRIF